MGVQWGKMVRELAQVEQAASEGFDFVHPVKDLVVNLSEEQVLQQKAHLQNGGVPFKVCAVPLPADVRVTQKGFNIYVWMEHLKNAASGMAELGCRKLVWSDGRARLLPVEGATAGSKEQLLQFLYMLCGVAAEFDMTVLVEPLGPRRTNFLNTMKETSEFLPRVRKENLSSVISLRELEQIGLSLSDLPEYMRLIDHVQMDNPLSYDGARICPRPDDGNEYRPFLQALKDAGYSADISLPDDADAGGLEYCRE
ncbi:MAG: sugar phosphate isomerase/epimerase, partial [Spirochaetaceae bacterium]